MITVYGLYLVDRFRENGYSYFFPTNALALYGACMAIANGFTVRVIRQEYDEDSAD